MQPYILLPPSEGKNTGGTSAPVVPTAAAKAMIEALQSYDGDQQKLLGVKSKALDAAIDVNKNILTSKSLPSIERYNGVVYKALDYPTLSAKAKLFANKHIRIISALFGLVAPQDLIPNYKLKIDKLGAARYWNPIIVKQLDDTYIIDLLPQAHKKACTYDNGTEAEFKIIENGKSKPAGHMGKHIKGRFVRWMCENQITNPDQFNEFCEEGFVWDGLAFIKRL